MHVRFLQSKIDLFSLSPFLMSISYHPTSLTIAHSGQPQWAVSKVSLVENGYSGWQREHLVRLARHNCLQLIFEMTAEDGKSSCLGGQRSIRSLGQTCQFSHFLPPNDEKQSSSSLFGENRVKGNAGWLYQTCSTKVKLWAGFPPSDMHLWN